MRNFENCGPAGKGYRGGRGINCAPASGQDQGRGNGNGRGMGGGGGRGRMARSGENCFRQAVDNQAPNTTELGTLASSDCIQRLQAMIESMQNRLDQFMRSK